jgi:hypothetical protein
MHIVPPYLSEQCQSNAERKVFKAFKNIELASKSYLFHSVNLPEHQYKQWGEIDFLLISTNGIMVFEVKGGRISRKDGVWIFTDRYGKNHRKTEGPNDQAKTAMFALKKKLSKEFPKIDFSKIPVGWAMIFPDIDYAAKTLELPFEMVCDHDSIQGDGFEVFIKNIYSYFKKKISHPKELTPSEIQQLSNYIRPNIDLIPKLKTSIDETNLWLVKGTDEQYSVLNSALENERILCTGGGGTGKTLLAIEIAKSNPNKRILVTCKSEILAKFIKGQISSDLIDVMSLSQIMTNKAFFSEEFEIINTLKPVYEMAIIDEGQDLLSFSFINFLDKVLKNNFENGSWRWFMDLNNQAGVDSAHTIIDINYPPEDAPPFFNASVDSLKANNEESELVFEMLNDAKPSKIKLTHNCRNTEEIIYDTQLNTGADIGIARAKGRGTYPLWESINSAEEATLKLEQILDEWEDEIDYLNDIVILSTVSYSLSSAYNLPQKWQDKIQILTKENVLNQNPRKVLFSDISNFKGLDKPIVIVIDIEKTLESTSNATQKDKDLINKGVEAFLYVAMTRSNSMLWITVSPEFDRFLKEQKKINYPKMIKN